MLLFTSTSFYDRGETDSRHTHPLFPLLWVLPAIRADRMMPPLSFFPSFHQSEQPMSELLTSRKSALI
ncbi:hypothetical protein H4Q32_021877 [Labeo rohita]|uniref:Uncharacterized protein n=1 Tax=Labeo rohita TaxID=84645 RepID=A0ABQ8MRT6_LABRO|nr:hypothetical protein H4Q32_021877 [Labeo rohita]